MFKSTAAVIGFLFGLSTAYYLSFWSFFNINVFQYMAVEDIIKGIAYPLRFGGVWLLGIALFIIMLFILITFSSATSGILTSSDKKVFTSLVVSSIIACISYLLFADSLLLGMILSVLLSLVMFRTYGVIDELYAKQAVTTTPAESHPVAKLSDSFVVYCAIFLSINAVISGQIEARAIHSGKRFNYIVAKDLPKDKVDTIKPYLIFLGAVSEKYIFIDKEEDERFILDKGELPDLKIHYYDYSNRASIGQLNRALGKRLASPRK